MLVMFPKFALFRVLVNISPWSVEVNLPSPDERRLGADGLGQCYREVAKRQYRVQAPVGLWESHGDNRHSLKTFIGSYRLSHHFCFIF